MMVHEQQQQKQPKQKVKQGKLAVNKTTSSKQEDICQWIQQCGWHERQYCDLALQLENGHSIQCHRLIMSQSPAIRQLLNNNINDTTNREVVVEWPTGDHEAAEWCAAWLYQCQTVDNIHGDYGLLFRVMLQAQQLQLNDLHSQCHQLLLTTEAMSSERLLALCRQLTERDPEGVEYVWQYVMQQVLQVMPLNTGAIQSQSSPSDDGEAVYSLSLMNQHEVSEWCQLLAKLPQKVITALLQDGEWLLDEYSKFKVMDAVMQMPPGDSAAEKQVLVLEFDNGTGRVKMLFVQTEDIGSDNNETPLY